MLSDTNEIKNQYLKDFVEALKEAFREENGWYYDIYEDAGYIAIKYIDAYIAETIYIQLNEYGIPGELYIEKAYITDEIVDPYSCHECSQDCQYYDEEKEKCTIIEEDISREYDEWEGKLIETSKIEVRRIVMEVQCEYNGSHYHHCRGYAITIKGGLLPQTVIALDELFDYIVELAEKTAGDLK
jgi:hypothetical protein